MKPLTVASCSKPLSYLLIPLSTCCYFLIFVDTCWKLVNTCSYCLLKNCFTNTELDFLLGLYAVWLMFSFFVLVGSGGIIHGCWVDLSCVCFGVFRLFFCIHSMFELIFYFWKCNVVLTSWCTPHLQCLACLYHFVMAFKVLTRT